MPTYEYVCASCRRHTEAVQGFSDPPLTECPHCGGPLKRVFHPIGIVLKGSGFYTTDNRSSRKGGTKPTETTSEPAASDSSSADSSSAAKPSAESGASKPVEKKPASEPSKPKSAEKT